jgi:hypothetical protein
MQKKRIPVSSPAAATNVEVFRSGSEEVYRQSGDPSYRQVIYRRPCYSMFEEFGADAWLISLQLLTLLQPDANGIDDWSDVAIEFPTRDAMQWAANLTTAIFRHQSCLRTDLDRLIAEVESALAPLAVNVAADIQELCDEIGLNTCRLVWALAASVEKVPRDFGDWRDGPLPNRKEVESQGDKAASLKQRLEVLLTRVHYGGALKKLMPERGTYHSTIQRLDDWLPAEFFAERYGIPASRLRQARRRGKLRAKNNGGRPRYSFEDVLRLWPQDVTEGRESA